MATRRKKKYQLNRYIIPALALGLMLLMTSCGQSGDDQSSFSNGLTYEDSSEDASLTKGQRDNTIKCMKVDSPGKDVYEAKDIAWIDVSNMKEGYISANYYGTCEKVKLQITGPDSTTYTYNLKSGTEYFPLTGGDGAYTIGIYENIEQTQYAVALSEIIDVRIENIFGPNLYPNQYCMFDDNTKYVKKSADLAFSMDNDLEYVTNVFNYVLCTMSYDKEKAENIEKGYVCNLDDIYEKGTGICLDYAAIMTCLLRSQGIPTMLQVGYAGKAYHAWINVYIEEKGWVNGIIEFDGVDWSLMDPTLADTSAKDQLENFIGDGSKYTLKYIY